MTESECGLFSPELKHTHGDCCTRNVELRYILNTVSHSSLPLAMPRGLLPYCNKRYEGEPTVVWSQQCGESPRGPTSASASLIRSPRDAFRPPRSQRYRRSHDQPQFTLQSHSQTSLAAGDPATVVGGAEAAEATLRYIPRGCPARAQPPQPPNGHGDGPRATRLA